MLTSGREFSLGIGIPTFLCLRSGTTPQTPGRIQKVDPPILDSKTPVVQVVERLGGSTFWICPGSSFIQEPISVHRPVHSSGSFWKAAPRKGTAGYGK